jgi:hypothetical protein
MTFFSSQRAVLEQKKRVVIVKLSHLEENVTSNYKLHAELVSE